ncbi:serine/threonine-protein kinase [Aestuariimicrobium ganziense]|uniref:serine/threonine-protein kinase n=1 Tax=Aestuariimicrobium ganziense TaxID=2773677 RepID=UPI001941A545|nr:serine/threonine-protein kinase [Aestuariimicrobium ganziense]
MGEVFGGRYELVDPLASGGAGVVWRVWDRREGEYKAGKVLKQSDSASLLRFMRETGWRITHPHVVTPLGWVGEDDRVMFTMPLIHGGNLSGLMRAHGPLPPRWAQQATDQLLDALEKVHGQGLVHRDVKPANLMLQPTREHSVPDEPPHVLLSDFGIAAPVGEPRMTRVSEVIGTPGYMSPEAELGLDPEPRQDLYGVGVVLLEMLTGQRPPKQGRPTIPPAAAQVPLGRFIADLLADEADRIPTASEARSRLAETPLPASRAVPVRVLDIVPPLPEGWTENGPSDRRPGLGPTPAVPPPAFAATTLRPPSGGTPSTGPRSRNVGAPPVGWGGTQTPRPQQPMPRPVPQQQPVQHPMPQQPMPQQPMPQQPMPQQRPAFQQWAPPPPAQRAQGQPQRWTDRLGSLGTPAGLSLLILGACIAVAGLIMLFT